jgi:uncharacterized protein (DUF2147 family)
MFAARLAAVTLAFCIWNCAISAQGQGILGIWWTDQNKGRVEIANCTPPAQGLCGKIIWIKEPNDKQGRPLTDKANKNASLRNRPILGLQIFGGWREVGPNKWKGSVYDPEDGQAYDVEITMTGDKLKLEGCIAFLCDSDTWMRYRGQ